MSQRTLILVKPDGVRRNIIGDVISRIERKGLKVVALEMRTIEAETAHSHYAEHAERPFFGELVDFITSGPLVAMVAEGDRAIEAFRALAGATDPVKALPGTISGDYALQVAQNIVHGSDSPEARSGKSRSSSPSSFNSGRVRSVSVLDRCIGERDRGRAAAPGIQPKFGKSSRSGRPGSI